MPIATLPEEAPFSPWVKPNASDVAAMVKAPAEPAHDVPSVMVACVVLVSTLMPTEAPMPTLLPDAPPSDGRAREKASDVFVADTVTSPLPVIVIAAGPPRPTVASASLLTTFTATDPAMPILPPPPPDVASVCDELVLAMNFCLSLP